MTDAPRPVSFRASREEARALRETASFLKISVSDLIRLLVFGERQEHRSRRINVFEASEELRERVQ